jgi:hypothetical protein
MFIKKKIITLIIVTDKYENVKEKVFEKEGKSVDNTFIYKIISIMDISNGLFIKNNIQSMLEFKVKVLCKVIELEKNKMIYGVVNKIVTNKGYLLINGMCKIDVRISNTDPNMLNKIVKCKIIDYLYTDNLDYIKVKGVIIN